MKTKAIMNSKNFITKQGYQQLTEELEVLKEKRNQLIDRIEEFAQPDENGDDSLAVQLKSELELTNGQIEKLEDALANSEIVNGSDKSSSVQVGSTVKLKLSGSVVKEFQLVSQLEADPSQNKISDQSPLGQALIGKKINDQIEIDAPVGKLSYKIVSVN